MKRRAVPNVISASTAKTNLGQIMRRAEEKRDRFIVGRRGDPKVVIMGVRDFIDTIAPTHDWLEKSWAQARRKGKNKLTMRQIQAEIRAARREKHPR
jgi:prevent-host-death family protein